MPVEIMAITVDHYIQTAPKSSISAEDTSKPTSQPQLTISSLAHNQNHLTMALLSETRTFCHKSHPPCG
jgi:hypothetical protein